jgi:glutamyl/glutaminyl-tRNA synthetase
MIAAKALFGYDSRMTVKVRIAPSPTGYMHVGTAQSALFNYLFARQNGGEFYLRIEDTDRERSKPEYEAIIIEGLKWLGLDWDNTEIMRQSERTAIYRDYLQKLLDSGKAFWREYTNDEKLAMEKEGRTARDRVIVLKDDGDPERAITFDDMIRGPVTVLAKHVGQLVIAKSLDEPLYHFAVVIDDIDMGITHVIRGEDHISNTPKQLLIYEALGASVPRFAHLPLLLGADRSKLSKRNGDVSITHYQKDYLPEALVNFLGALSYTFEPEMLTRDEMVRQFDLAKVHKSGAVFDVKKLNWFNSQYIRLLAPAQFKTLIGMPDLPDVAVPVMTERLERLTDIGQFAYLWQIPDYDGALLRWKETSVEDTRRALEALASLTPITQETVDALVVEQFGGQKGSVYWPLRVALSGQKNSAGPLDIIRVVGSEEAHKRIAAALEKLSQ